MKQNIVFRNILFISECSILFRPIFISECPIEQEPIQFFLGSGAVFLDFHRLDWPLLIENLLTCEKKYI